MRASVRGVALVVVAAMALTMLAGLPVLSSVGDVSPVGTAAASPTCGPGEVEVTIRVSITDGDAYELRKNGQEVTDASKITDYTLQGALDGDGTFGFPPDNNLDAYTDCFEGGETHTVEFVDDVGDPPDILYVTVSNERLISDEAVEYETDNGGNKYKVTFETPITCGVGEQKVEMEFSSASRTSDGTYTVSIDGSTLSLDDNTIESNSPSLSEIDTLDRCFAYGNTYTIELAATSTDFSDPQLRVKRFKIGEVGGTTELGTAVGTPGDPAEVTITVNRAPTADATNGGDSFTGETTIVEGQTDIAFDGTDSSDPDGNPLTYAWDWVDGTTGTGGTTTYNYSGAVSTPGTSATFRPTLTVDDGLPEDNTSTDTAFATITVYSDLDGDGLADIEAAPGAADTDDDGDGITDSVESVSTSTVDLPANATTVSVGGSTYPDTDNDTLADLWDTDSDGDGIPDSVEGTNDTDGDGTANYRDVDSDDDGIPDSVETTTDTDGDGTPDYLDADSDDDGIPDRIEGDGDVDGDGTANLRDPDSDGDGIADSVENTTDTDSDGTANFFDVDSDDDGIDDSVEGRTDPDSDGTPNYLDADSDGDDIPDATEGTTDTDGDGTADYLDTDSDADGIPDVTEGVVDTDTDGEADYRDTDSDDDRVPDRVEGATDTDGDGTGNFRDVDSDDDTIPDSVEGTTNTDGDGAADYLDTDSDGDRIPDRVEGTGTGSAVDSLNVTLADSSLTTGGSTSLTAVAAFANGNEFDVTTLAALRSNDTAVVTVDANGTVSAVEAGQTRLNASLEGVNGTANVSVSDPPRQSRGGGGGGSSDTTESEPQLTTTTTETGTETEVTVQDAVAGEAVTVQREDSESLAQSESTSVDSLTITSETDHDFSVRVSTSETLDENNPDGAVDLSPDRDGSTPVGYLTIDHDLGEEVTEATIGFSVRSNRVGDGDVRLYRNVDGQWNPLETRFVSETGGVAQYEAITPGFSVFAIGVGESAEAGSDEESTETASSVKPTESQTTPLATAEETPGFGFTVGLVVLIGLGFAVGRRSA